MKNESVIEIAGMEFYAHHGCFEEERKIGTRFNVDLQLYTDTEKAQLSDELTQTVNYAEVYQRVKEEMAVPSRLIEHVARRITDRVLNDFPAIEKVSIRLSKLNPPLGEKIREVSISFCRP